MIGKSSKGRIFDIDDTGIVNTIATMSQGNIRPLKSEPTKVSPFRVSAKTGKPIEHKSVGETAFATATRNSGGGNGGRPSTTSAELTTFALQETLLNALGMDIANESSPSSRATINEFYRDIYYHDSICGSAVHLLSTLPFSDFTIVGDTARQTQIYMDACEALKMSTVLPMVSTEYNVVGAFLSSLDFDQNEKNFRGQLPHSIDFAEFTPPVYFGHDPKIKIRIPDHIKNIFKESGKDKANLPSLYSNVTEKSSNDFITLKEEDTIFIPRQGMIRDFAGVSYFRRVLAPWIIEKAFIRGMIDQSYKRQRPITHLTIDGETPPSPEEMAAVVQLFIDADLDPVASYVVTRSGINVNEVRNGGDYFKWSDVYDSLTTIKLRALGISESFLSSEANYATMEQTLSVFMEQMRSYRSMIQKEMFYDRVFVRIATENGFKKRRVETAGETAEISAKDKGRLALPTMQWQKRLLPEADDAYIQMLSTLEEKGVPLPIRIWAAAGGFNIDTLLESKSDDIQTREKVSEWLKERKPVTQNPDGENEGSEEAGFTQIIPFAKRKFEDKSAQELMDVPNLDSNGRRRVTTAKGRKILNEKKHKMVAEVASNLAKLENARIKDSKPVVRGFSVVPKSFLLLDDEDEDED